MGIRFIALDLDGTLLNSQHQISPGNRAAVRACVDQGIHVIVATGRLFGSAGGYAQNLGLHGPQITLNGGAFGDVDSGEVTPRALLNPTQIDQTCRLLQDVGLEFALFAADRIYALPEARRVEQLVNIGEPPATVLPYKDLIQAPQPVKLLSFLYSGPMDEQLAARAPENLEVFRSGAEYFEFLPQGINKGSALRELMQRYQIQPDEVLAIGDGENDLSMFAVAGLSVAMGTAPEVVKAGATEVTDDCNSDGVAQALRRFVL